MDKGLSLGISIIVCCYNSTLRLKPTLTYLSRLVLPKDRTCEALIIDNASKDNTAEFAKQIWVELGKPFEMKVLFEEKQGLTYARQRGIAAAKYELLIFCDDDNWLSPSYLQKAIEIMEENPTVAVACGQIEPVFELEPPKWFLSIQQVLALGRLQEYTGYVEPPTVPWGAGMVLRTKLLKELNFKSLLSDRVGSRLSSGGDTELCYRLKQKGYKWWYDDRLKLKHEIPSNRFSYKYLIKLFKGFGEAEAIIKKYYTNDELPYAHKPWLIRLELFKLSIEKFFIYKPVEKLQLYRKKYFLRMLWSKRYFSRT